MPSDATKPPAPLFSVTGLRKTYGAKVVLDGVDLVIESGTRAAVTGPNGSGKSTLLRCLAGLAGHQGETLVEGVPVTRARSRLGYLPQSVGLPEWATVGEVLQLFARLRRADPADTPLPQGFLPHVDTPVRVLSGGQAQRVALTVALLGSPSVLLLDEPAANLDDSGREMLWHALDQMVGLGGAVLIATPSGPETRPMADRVLELSRGKLEERLIWAREMRQVVS